MRIARGYRNRLGRNCRVRQGVALSMPGIGTGLGSPFVLGFLNREEYAKFGLKTCL